MFGRTYKNIYQIIVKPWRKKFLTTAKLLDGSNYQLGVKSPRPIFTNMCSDFEGIYLTNSINKNMQPGINATKTNILHLQESYTSTYISFFS